jgi:3-polyprenyl-4-hydroxybenzoate decarboxylase
MPKPEPTRTQSPLGRGTHFTSLRDYPHALAQLGDLREVKREVDTNLEIGAIIRRTHEIYAPAPLFTNIRGHAGYPTGISFSTISRPIRSSRCMTSGSCWPTSIRLSPYPR